MKKYHIISNNDRDCGLSVAREISDYILTKGGICSCEGIDRETDIDLSEYGSGDSLVDCILVLGGDGTIIQVARAAAKYNLPIFGINLGNLGYLAEVERDGVYPAIDRLLNDEFDIEERMMLSAGGKISLNDVVISRSGRLRVIEYELKVNGKVLSKCLADGVIVSTPTGSTGYNLSSGGPIVEPDANLIVVTHICPHTLNARPIVLSSDDIIEICVSGGKGQESPTASVTCDGMLLSTLKETESIVIKRSTSVTKIIKINKESFLDVLARKMNN